MRLARFIEQHVDEIVDEWAEFAQTHLPPARELPPEALRDHAKRLLQEAAIDMQAEQSREDKHQKSRGQRPGNAPGLTAMAKADAEQRFRQGFSLSETVSEYRALRANVIRRWREQAAEASLDAVDELIRFNETVDQAVGECIGWYVERVEESRNLMLGVLGHDLRNPLGAARMSAEYLLRINGLSDTLSKAAARILSSTTRMQQMVSDLLDYTRARLGEGLPLKREIADFGRLCRDAVSELEALHPDKSFQLVCTGDLRGEWDPARVQQLTSNLVANAVQHGEPGPVLVSVDGEAEFVVLRVHNQGPPIAPAAVPTLFDPLMRTVVKEVERREGSSGLGLGLFIVREIAVAHGGEVRVASSKRDGTTFTARLPRHPREGDRAAAPARRDSVEVEGRPSSERHAGGGVDAAAKPP